MAFSKRKPMSKATAKKAFEEVKNKTEAAKLVDEALSGTNAEAILSASKEITPEKIADALTKAQLGISSSLDSVKSQVFAHLDQLDALRTAVAQQKATLEELYGKEAVVMSVEELLSSHEAKQQALADAYSAKLDALKEKAVEAEVTSAKKISDAGALYKRASEEFAYKLSIEERDARDAFQQRVREYELEWEERKRAEERELEERIKDVERREVDAVVSIEKADAMAAKLESEVDKARKAGAASAYAEMNVKMSLAKAEYDKVSAVQTATIDNLRGKVEELYASKEAAEQAAERAQQRVETIATSAMEAQSGKAALRAAQDMADRTSGKDKGR